MSVNARCCPGICCQKTWNEAWTDRPAFNPLAVKQRFRLRPAASFDLTPLDALEVEGLCDFPIVEEVLHDEQVGFGLSISILQVADLDGVEPQQFGEDSRLARCGLHIPKVGGS